MALIFCRECGKQISDTAINCPHCGYVYKNFEYIEKKQYATFNQRFSAYFIDMIILILGFMVVGIGVAAITNQIDLIELQTVVLVCYFVFLLMTIWLYFAVMESSKFQGTLGKINSKIKVTDLDGNRISFGRATARFFSKILSRFFWIGFIMAAFTEKKQGLHDMIAGTLVKPK